MVWFKGEIVRYSGEEATYKFRLRQHIVRQYLILNPEAGDGDAQRAVGRDWSRDEVFRDRVSSTLHFI